MIRRKLLLKRNNLSAASRRAKSRRIAENLKKLSEYRKAETVMFYITHGTEVGTEHLIEDALKDGKTVALPVADTKRRKLCAAKICSINDDCGPGAYGIREPKHSTCKPVSHKKIDMVIVPGIAFDEKGYRIGYGKGYYDGWLTNFPAPKIVALAYDFQLVGQLPKDSHDKRMGTIITETRTIKTTIKPLDKN